MLVVALITTGGGIITSLCAHGQKKMERKINTFKITKKQ